MLNFIYLFIFINYNTLTNYILNIYDLSNLDHVFGVVSQTRASEGNRTHDPHANSLAHYLLDYQGALTLKLKYSFTLNLSLHMSVSVALYNGFLALLDASIGMIGLRFQ